MLTFEEDKIEFYPGNVVYSFKLELPDQEPQTIKIARDTNGNINISDKIHPVLAVKIKRMIKDHVAKLYSQGDY